jgi:transglutaminase-like putative cysteine protease
VNLSPNTRLVRVGCELVYSLPSAAPLMFALEPLEGPRQAILESSLSFSPQPQHFNVYRDNYGNRIWRLLAGEGWLSLQYNALAQVPASSDPIYPDLRKIAVQDLPNSVLVYTLPSRYCPSDRFTQLAWEHFGGFTDGWSQVQAICDWLYQNIEYKPGSGSSTSALEALEAREAVCRDFAHLGVTFCRALSIPARYVCGYLPDIGVTPDPVPMDFHAWFEAYLGNGWHTFDARHNTPRTGRVVIGTGRDAADVAFSTIYGATQLNTLRVWAEAAG